MEVVRTKAFLQLLEFLALSGLLLSILLFPNFFLASLEFLLLSQF